MDNGLVCLTHIGLVCFVYLPTCSSVGLVPLLHHCSMCIMMSCSFGDVTIATALRLTWLSGGKHSRRRHHSCLIDGTVVEPNVLCKSKGSPFTLMGVYRQGILQPNKETWRLVCIVFLWDKLIRNILRCPLAQGGCDFISLCLLKSRDLSYALYVPQASSLKIYLILPLTVCHVKVILVIWCVFF